MFREAYILVRSLFNAVRRPCSWSERNNNNNYFTHDLRWTIFGYRTQHAHADRNPIFNCAHRAYLKSYRTIKLAHQSFVRNQNEFHFEPATGQRYVAHAKPLTHCNLPAYSHRRCQDFRGISFCSHEISLLRVSEHRKYIYRANRALCKLSSIVPDPCDSTIPGR